MAPHCDYPGAPWLSQLGPPAPDTALPSSGRDKERERDVARDKEDGGKYLGKKRDRQD